MSLRYSRERHRSTPKTLNHQGIKSQAPAKLEGQGVILLELDPEHAPKVKQDLSSRDRVFVAVVGVRRHQSAVWSGGGWYAPLSSALRTMCWNPRGVVNPGAGVVRWIGGLRRV